MSCILCSLDKSDEYSEFIFARFIILLYLDQGKICYTRFLLHIARESCNVFVSFFVVMRCVLLHWKSVGKTYCESLFAHM